MEQERTICIVHWWIIHEGLAVSTIISCLISYRVQSNSTVHWPCKGLCKQLSTQHSWEECDETWKVILDTCSQRTNERKNQHNVFLWAVLPPRASRTASLLHIIDSTNLWICTGEEKKNQPTKRYMLVDIHLEFILSVKIKAYHLHHLNTVNWSLSPESPSTISDLWAKPPGSEVSMPYLCDVYKIHLETVKMPLSCCLNEWFGDNDLIITINSLALKPPTVNLFKLNRLCGKTFWIMCYTAREVN